MQISRVSIFFLACFVNSVLAQTYSYNPAEDVVGNISIHTIKEGDNFLQLAQIFRIGFNELVDANPEVDPWIPEEDAQIIIPTQYVLPNVEREGVIINLAELRLYQFHGIVNDVATVSTYPVSVGKDDQWETPLSYTRITSKIAKPNWYPPESIRKEHEENNDPLPKVVPPGPDNPLGDYKLGLALSGYLIHGTNVPEGIGMRVTHGCIRLHPTGIEKLFKSVEIDTPVTIVNQPYKVGWKDNKLYVETHSEIEEQEKASSRNLTEFVQLVVAQTKEKEKDRYKIFWERGYKEAREKRGIPFLMSLRDEKS
ncbi:MAG: L,D-transpeptidase family protein [Gammaproteobacteria bacterium]|nr:L,D-transpeptidase family protein [Gammaproteobacteria bacterium]